MKNILFSATALVALSASTAFAADLPSRVAAQAPAPAAVPVTDWAGLYVGLQGGYDWGHSSQRDSGHVADGDYSVSGPLFGGTVGYALQNGSLVYGVEGDAAWSNLRGSSASCGTGHVCGTKVDAFGTLRGRVGMSFGSTLLFATGGAAIANINAYDVTAPGYSDTATRLGWTVGAGVEQKLTGNWSAKAEYLYAGFARSGYFTIAPNTQEKVDLNMNVVRVGVNYKFQ